MPPAGGTPAVHMIAPAFVYVLGCVSGDKRITYVGWCVDLDQRLTAHNAGRGARSTRGRTWALLYAERYDTRREAMSREVFLKRDRPFRAALAKLL
jgi:putative endonuclease